MKATDEQIAESWRRTQNYAEVGRELNMERTTARMHIMRLRAAGIELPEARKAGYALTSERAREIRSLRKRNND